MDGTLQELKIIVEKQTKESARLAGILEDKMTVGRPSLHVPATD